MARGEDALTVLENPKSRSQFIDELMEVKMMHNNSNFAFISDFRSDIKIFVNIRSVKRLFYRPLVVTVSHCTF